MTPFFILWLIVAQIWDLGAFVLNRLQGTGEWLEERTATAIDITPLSLQTKYTLMQAASWLPTVVLTAILIVLGADWWREFNERKILTQPDGSEMTVSSGSGIINAFLPTAIRLASDSAIIMVEEEELIARAEAASNFNETERKGLSQKERINLALVYHYLGSEQGFHYWLESARAMDPNERLLAKE